MMEKRNTYTFKKDKFEITLYPQRDAKMPRKVEQPPIQIGNKPKTVMILNENQFEAELKGTWIARLLVGKEVRNVPEVPRIILSRNFLVDFLGISSIAQIFSLVLAYLMTV